MDHTAPAVFDLGLLLLLAVLAGRLARWLGLPAVIGYLVVGVAVSPFTPGYVANREQLSVLADVGVVLLLFEVGIEVNPLRLLRESRGVLLAAPIQVLVTWGLAGAAFWALGTPVTGAALLGLCVAMSSSVVVVNITRSTRRTTDSATEEQLLGWSVLQDLVGVGCAFGLLIAAGLGGRPAGAALAGLAGFLAVAGVSAIAVPWLLRRLRGEHDLFLLLSVGAGLLLAGVGSLFFGIPLALAAFVAGLVIAESPVAAEARRRILPFRDVFAVMFFVSLGTVIDPGRLPGALPWLGLLVGLVLVAKVALVWLLARIARVRARPLQLAIGLGQIGEFSYVLGAIGLAAGVITQQLQAALVGAVVLTIAASSVAVRFAGPRPEAGA